MDDHELNRIAINDDKHGISGRIRKYAFGKSESSYGRWIPLVMADRIGIIEGLIDDIRNKRFPKIINAKGVIALIGLSRKNLIRSVAISGLVTAGAITLLVLKNRKKEKIKN